MSLLTTTGQTSIIAAKKMKFHANMTSLKHLGKALVAKPYVFEDTMKQLFTSRNYFSDNPLTSLLGGAKEKEITGMSWEWKVKGADTRPLTVIENVEDDNNITVGRGIQTFRIKLDENWLLPGDHISPGNADFQVRVMDEVQNHGNGYVYNVRLVTGDKNKFLPKKYLEPGQAWTKMFSSYGEGSHQDGSTLYSGGTELRDSLGKLRKRYSVTDYAAEEVLAVKLMDSEGNMYNSWIKYAEAELWRQWHREVEIAYWYNKKSSNLYDTNGRNVDTFAGIQEKLKDSHQHYYTHLSPTLLEEFLMDIFYSRVKPGSGRKIKVFTGEYGMLQFSNAMATFLKDKGWVIANSNFSPINKVSSPYNSNAYAVGYQFVKYIMHNGAELELIHNPLYDDRSLNFEIDPITGYPVESMRFTFLDFSGEGIENNIQLVRKKDGFKFGYRAGLISPYGPNQGELMSSSEEAYSMHISKQLGVHIEDISKCGELILRRNN